MAFEIAEGQRDFDYTYEQLTHEEIARRYTVHVKEQAKKNYVPDDDDDTPIGR